MYRPKINRYQKVKEILDQLVGGRDIAAHGAFWRGLTRDQFVEQFVFGYRLVVPGEPENSNLLHALRGDPPFGSDVGTPGALIRRMPAGLPPASSPDIAFIETWIADGCPEDEVVEPADAELEAMAAGGPIMDPAHHNAYWREFDNWAMYEATPEINGAIGAFFPTGPQWFAAARDAAQVPAWESAVSATAQRGAIELLASRQQDTVESYYGDPVDLNGLLESYALFGRGILPPDPLRPQDTQHQMNGATMWFFWSSFADACLHLGIAPEFWRANARAILLGLMNDGVFRGRYVVNGFSADEAGSQAMHDHVSNLADDDATISAELRSRFVDSGAA